MSTDQEKLARDRMRANPFAPMGDAANNEYRKAHSLEYIAFYLGEIEGHLSKIAAQLDARQIPQSVLRRILRITNTLSRKT